MSELQGDGSGGLRDIPAIVGWLIDGARTAPSPDKVLEQLCDGLLAAGLPLARVSVLVQTLHPDIMGRAFRWQPGEPVKITAAKFDVLDTDMFKRSPAIHINRTGEPLRRRLADPACPNDFPILDELRADGLTDYYAVPLRFMNGETHTASFATKRPAGFTDEEIASLDAVTRPLARVAEVWALRRVASNLLSTYVGRQAGERILAGRIRRGHTESIDAAIWLSDLRGFTALADKLPPNELIDVLNRYFDCQVPAIQAHDGEVLKFMGDGLLAIFPIASERPAGAVCAAALAAVREAIAAVANLRAEAEAPALRELKFAISLHLGAVLYGNIGGGDRLDFTCIGPAVNLAARMEKLAAEQGRTVIASADFAKHCQGAFTSLGAFPLRGFRTPREVYGLEEDK
jgi:adenylate cyclase